MSECCHHDAWCPIMLMASLWCPDNGVIISQSEASIWPQWPIRGRLGGWQCDTAQTMDHQLERPESEPKPIRRRQETLTTRHNHAGQPIRGQPWPIRGQHPGHVISPDQSEARRLTTRHDTILIITLGTHVLCSTGRFAATRKIWLFDIYQRFRNKRCWRIYILGATQLICSDSVFLEILKNFKRAIVSANLKVTWE